MSLLHVQRSADNSLGLHHSDFRIGNRQTAATVTHHGVELVERINDSLDLFHGLALSVSQLLDVFFGGGYELVERGIQEPDGYRVAFQSFVQLFEVALLNGEDLIQSSFPFFHGVGADHFAECVDPVAFKEHVLGTAQTDTFGAQLTSLLSVGGGVGIGADFQTTILVSPAHYAAQFASDGGVHSGDDAVVDVTGGTIDGDIVAFVEFLATQGELLVFFIHGDFRAAGYAAGAHTTSHNGSVRGHTTTNGQNALRSFHTGDVFRRGFQTNQNYLFASSVPFFSIFCSEDDLTASSTRRSAQALAHGGSSLQSSSVELRVQQGVQVSGVDHQNSFFFGAHAFVHQIAGDLQRSLSSSLTVTGLEHEQFAVFHGELHVLHVAVVIFQDLANIFELSKSFGEFLFHFRDLHGGANTSNHVFALSIGQEFTEQALCAGSRVTSESNTGAAVIAHVTESHALYVNSGTPGIRNIVVTTVHVGAGVVPAAEHSLDSAHELFFGIAGEVSADFFFVLGFELTSQFLQIVSGELYVLSDALLGLHLVDELFEVLLTDFHNHVGVHLDEPTIAVPSPAGVAGLFRQHFHHVFVQAQVQDGVHHAGHGSTGAGTNGNQQRVFLIAEFLAGDLFHLGDVLHDLSLNFRIDDLAIFIVLGAGLSGDGKALRNRQTDVGHLGQVCAFAAEQFSHVCVTFGKQVHILLAHNKYLHRIVFVCLSKGETR